RMPPARRRSTCSSSLGFSLLGPPGCHAAVGGRRLQEVGLQRCPHVGRAQVVAGERASAVRMFSCAFEYASYAALIAVASSWLRLDCDAMPRTKSLAWPVAARTLLPHASSRPAPSF